MKSYITLLTLLSLFAAGPVFAEEPQGSLSANGPFCVSGTGQLKFTATAGVGPFDIVYDDGVTNRTVNDVNSGDFFDVFINPVTVTTTYTLVSVTDSEADTRSNGFTDDEATITIDPMPVANVTGSQTICANGTATVGSGEASYDYGTILWTDDGVGSITAGATTLTPTYTAAAADGGNTVTLTMTVTSNNACGSATASDTYTLSVDPLPVANVTGSKIICEDGTATVGAGEASASYGTIFWTEDGEGSITSGETTLMPTYTAAAGDAGNTVTLTMTVTTDNPLCGTATASDTYIINVDHLPVANVTGSNIICETGTATVGAGEAVASDGTISWAHDGGGFITDGTTVTPTYHATAGDAGSTVTMIMTVTSNNTCVTATASDTYTVDIEHLPEATVAGSQTICANGSATVEAGAASYAYGTVQWAHNGSGSITNGTTLTPTYNAVSADGGSTVTLTMIVTSDNSCGAATAGDTYAVYVDPLPVATVSGSKTICENGTATVGAGEAVASNGTISWAHNGGGSITNGTTVTPTYHAVAGDAGSTITLTMTVTGTGTCNTETVSDTYTVNVDHLPVANVSGSKTICEDGTATVGAGEAVASYGTIFWTHNGDGSITNGTTVTPTYHAVASDAGSTVTMTMTVTSNNTCGTATASDTYTVNVNPSQTLSAVSQVLPVCSGYPAQVMLEGLIPGNTVTIHYSIAGVNQSAATDKTVDGTGKAYFYTENLDAGQNGKPLTITGLTTTFPSPSCYKIFSQSFILIVNTANTPSLTGNFSPCLNSTGNVYETDGSMTDYSWVVSAGGLVTDGGGPSDDFVEVTWNSAVPPQSVSVNYKNSNGCTSATPTAKTVDVKPLPTPDISGILPVCIHSGGHIYTTEEDMTLYSWSVSAGNTITSGGTGNMIIVTWDNATAPSVSINYTDENGCRALAPTTSPVTVNSLPVPSLDGFSSACAGSTGNVYSTDPGMSNYVWTVSSGGTVTSGGGSANNSVTVTWNTPGAQKVTVNYTNPATSCTALTASELPVTVNPLPVPSITGPASPNVNSTGNIYSTETMMTGYTWNVSAGGTINSGAGTNSISVTWNSPGAQTVSVNYTNSNSCTAISPTIFDVTVNALPVASGITIHGTARSGLTLNASYTYSDADGDAQGTSLYQWYTGTSSAGAGAIAIPSATTTSYKLTDDELTYNIGFSVRPAALTGATPGNLATTITWAGPVINDIPVATIQPITGSLNVNGLLTGHYVYSDTEGDIESGTSYQWYSSSDNGATFSIIPGETSISHLITNSEQGYYFKINITPGADSGSTPGDPEESLVVGPANSQPVASNVQIVSGTATVGSTLGGDYDFSDADPADLEGTSTFRWLRNGTIPIPGATSITYLVTPADEGYNLSFEVTPVSSTGYPDTGTPVQSAQTVPVVDTSPLTPVASQVCVEGIRAAGQVLRGKYYYNFYKSEGISTYQWYRNGIAIPGATGITYTLLQVEDIDSKADITFRVTPRSSNVPEKIGAPVTSNPLSRIILPKDYYSVSESDVTLSANVTGGVFSGTGVSGNIFSPRTAGSDGSPHTLSYQYIEPYPAHNCSQQASRLVYVNPNVSSFVGFDPLYCHDSGQDVITVTGMPAGATIVGFSLTDTAGIVSQSGTTVTIDPGRMRPGIDEDILFFSYYDGGTFYQISKSFKIDSVGTEIRILNLNDAYCEGDAKEYISIEGMYPIGGTANWTGDILLDTKAGSAYADPSLGAADVQYPVSYQYISPLGCYSRILYDTVMINPLPDPTFGLNPTYNIDGGAVDLISVQPDGIFSGNGVSGTKMFPDIAGLGEHEIRYAVTDTNGCSAELGKKTIVRIARGNFTGIPAVICYSDTTYRVSVTGLPDSVTVTGFSNTKNTLAYTMGFTYADYNVPAAGEGLDTLKFSYKWDSVDYDISTALNIDSLGQVEIKNLATDDLICDNMAPYELFPSITGGTFTGPVSGSYLDPTKGLGPAVVTYTYTNIKTGCSINTAVPVTIYPAPKIAFAPDDVCIEGNADTTLFINSTSSIDVVQTWKWEFSDAGGTTYSDKKNAGHLYITGGLQQIVLTAITVNNCPAKKESTFNLGVRPDADFYWRSDCLHPGESLILRDTTKSFSPILSRSWKVFNGSEFSTAEKEALFPKTDTGYVKIEYIVRTTYANCIDTVMKDIYIKPAITIPADGYFETFTAGVGGWIKGEEEGNSWTMGPLEWDVTASGKVSWFTNYAPGSENVESSSVVSPCFDFRTTQRPLVKLNMLKRFTRDRDGASLQYRVGNEEEWHSVGALEDGIVWYNSAVIRGEPGGNQIGWTTRGDPDTSWVESIHTLDELVGERDVVFRLAYGSDGASREYQGIALDDIWIGERSRNVLVEHFTNTLKTECSDANSFVDDIVNKRPGDVIGIQYHTNFDGRDPYYDDNPGDASARILFYGLSKAPYTFIDGGIQSDFAYMYSYANAASRIDSIDVTNRGLIPALFNIELVTDTISGDLSVSGKIKALKDIDADNLVLFLAVTEKENSEYTGPANEKVYYNVFRKFIPDAGGITLKNKWAKLDEQTIGNQVWTMENIPDNSDIEVIAFIQNTITKEVYQASSFNYRNIRVGIEDAETAAGRSFRLYPNPTVNSLTIQFEEPLSNETDIKIIDIRGKAVREYTTGKGMVQFSIDNLDFKDGIYFVRVSSKGIDLGYQKLVVSGF